MYQKADQGVKFYIKGLDLLRGIAALVVLIGHIELFKNRYNLKNWFDNDFFSRTGGHTSVILFFALSGFLITYLLIIEKEKKNNINLKKFYVRRIFRVWPLYFIVLIISYTIFDYDPSIITVTLCFTIFPNIAHAFGIGWSVSPQIWSIGVEEQFYVFWPILIKFFKNILVVTISVFLIFSILPHLIQFIAIKFFSNDSILKIVDHIYFGTKFNCMAAGGFFAVLYYNNYKFIRILNYNLLISLFFIIFPFVLWFSGFHLIYFIDELYSILFSISILNIAVNQNFFNYDFKIIDFLYKVLSYLGKISYGIYMYHWIILEILFRNKMIFSENSIIVNLYLYLLTLILTILVSHFSYYYFESRFLKIKDKFYNS